jgi:DNA gyrase subunit A
MNETGQVIQAGIEDEMKKSYIDYAMSVIIGRALPDVRDGLKPVHRRILYSMYESGVTHDKPYKKSARIVGDVMGKYHPHGDAAIYDALVRMAQEFSLRAVLVDGQGNFGSIDGDPAAAMRYTEVRLDMLAEEMITDIDKNTVDFQPNYDESLREPVVLPARIPAVLVNGSQGIAVGMATNIPPHNLGEIVDAAIAVIDKPKITVKDLCKIVKGPDFPTGAYIYGDDGIKKAFETGRGSIVIRGRAFTEKLRKGRDGIIVSEIPYQVNKSSLLQQIATLVKLRKIDGIADIRDESDKQGTRIVLELRRGVNASIILNNLYKHTLLEKRFSIIMLALFDGRPEVVGLKRFLQAFVDHREEVVTRRTLFDLKKAEERLHILEGLKVATEHIDAIIGLIKKSKDPNDAKIKLMRRYHLSDLQAQAILDIRLQRLTSLERLKVKKEHEEVQERISRLKEILVDDSLKMNVIKEELTAVKEKYADPRRTEIISETEELTIEDFIEEEDMVITVTRNGYIKRSPLSVFRKHNRGSKGTKGMATRDGDFVEDIFIASTHHYILILTEKGRLFWLKVYDIPELSASSKGQAIANLIQIGDEDAIATATAVTEFNDDEYLIMVTRNGFVKKTTLSEFSSPRSSGIIAISVDSDDRLIGSGTSDGSNEILIASRMGKAIRFSEEDVRPMGRAARGTKAMNLGKGDFIVGMSILSGEDLSLLTITENGFGKKTFLKEYSSQSRGGSGRININVSKRNGPVTGIMLVKDSDELLVVSASGKALRTKAKDIPSYGRNTQGVKIMDVDGEDNVVGAAKISESIKK